MCDLTCKSVATRFSTSLSPASKSLKTAHSSSDEKCEWWAPDENEKVCEWWAECFGPLIPIYEEDFDRYETFDLTLPAENFHMACHELEEMPKMFAKRGHCVQCVCAGVCAHNGKTRVYVCGSYVDVRLG